MRTILLGTLVVVATSALSAIWVGNAYIASPDMPILDGYELRSIAEIEGASLLCLFRLGAESRCHLFILDTRSGRLMCTHLHDDHPELAILVSPDKHLALFIQEESAYLLGADPRQWKIVASAPAGTAFGVYSEFPSFYPTARWTNASNLEVDLYPTFTIATHFMERDGVFVPSPPPPSSTIRVDIFRTELSSYLPI